MNVLNSFVNDLYDRISQTAYQLSLKDDKGTLGVRQMETAAKLVLPRGELFDGAHADASKRLERFAASYREKKDE